MITHLDLFSGIGGFAYAADKVFGDVEHVFCDNEPFAQAVLKKHWPESEIFDDIKSITADADIFRRIHGRTKEQPADRQQQARRKSEPSIEPPFLLTGGFPCQPFSQAGLRRGTADERHLWPEMLRVIRLTQPKWVIAENVRGITTWNDGLVFEQVCADLEVAGYAVQPFLIPALALDAPHRRDRVWFVAAKDTDDQRNGRWGNGDTPRSGRQVQIKRPGSGDAYHTEQPGLERHSDANQRAQRRQKQERPDASPAWSRNWTEVAAELCSMDDGLPVELDGLKLSKPQHRAAQLKAYGNAIVPQVAIQILKSIKEVYA